MVAASGSQRIPLPDNPPAAAIVPPGCPEAVKSYEMGFEDSARPPVASAGFRAQRVRASGFGIMFRQSPVTVCRRSYGSRAGGWPDH